jgi:hypothetical protein
MSNPLADSAAPAPSQPAAWLMGNPAKLELNPAVLEMLRICYNEEIAEFKGKDRIPGALFRIIRVRFQMAGLLVQQGPIWVNRDGVVVPEGHQVSTITKLVRRLCAEGKL